MKLETQADKPVLHAGTSPAHPALTAGERPEDIHSIATKTRWITFLVLLIAALISLSALAYFFSQNSTNIYGDGIAHLNIARKVVDCRSQSLWQRYVQLGTPWLPLPHVLMLPLVWNDTLWRTGLAGSIVSAISFIIAAAMLFKLSLLFYCGRTASPVYPALVSLIIFALNPSNLYMQSTPMTELPFMAVFISSIYFFQRWAIDQRWWILTLAAILMALSCLTRYEAWAVLPFAGILALLLSNQAGWRKIYATALWGAIAAIGPLYWLWHNWIIYKNPLEFLTGPYSARSIFATQIERLSWADFVIGNWRWSLLWAGLTVAISIGVIVAALGAFGLFNELIARRKQIIRYSPTLLLALPFLFFIFSLYRGEIQVFPISALTLLNVRYGLPHLLAAAIFAPSVCLLISKGRPWMGALIIAVLITFQYAFILRNGPQQLEVHQEPLRNNVNSRDWRGRSKLAAYLREHPPQGPILMHSGYLGPVVMRGNLRFSQIIHEGVPEYYEPGQKLFSTVSTVILEEGGPLWKRLMLDEDFHRQFKQVYSVSSSPILSVWEKASFTGAKSK